MNLYTSPIMINKITFWTTNQDSMKVSKVFEPTKRKLGNKNLGNCVIYSQISPPSLFFPDIFVIQL